MPLFISVLLFALGASLASFAGVVVTRLASLPAGRSAWRALLGRSRCEGCGRTLAIHELVPVLAWLLVAGRCSRCGCRVPVIYPVSEALAGVLFAGLFLAA